MKTARRMLILRIFATLVVAGGMLVGCNNLAHPDETATEGQNPLLDSNNTIDALESGTTLAPQNDGEEEEDGFTVTLSEGSAQPAETEPLTVVEGQPLSAEAAAAIFARLPNLPLEAGAQQEFRLPDESLPPPRPGETVAEVFPPEAENAPPEVPGGPLEVLRYAPQGEVEIAPFINVTFNQPMVPLTDLGTLEASEMPVRIEPALPGTWRWLGTRTLDFRFASEQLDRLPMATEFTVTIPAGTTSQTGGVLAEDVQFRFSTPPPRLQKSYPGEETPQPLQPLIFIAFDQRIDPAAVLDTITVEADGQPVDVCLATEAEIAADERVSNLVAAALEDRRMVFRPVDPLQPDTSVTVSVGPGTPSAEGPRLTENAQTFRFRTYAPLEVTDYGCNWSGDLCRPLDSLFIRFDNPIDTANFREDMLTISPEIPGAVVKVFGNRLVIDGAIAGQTTYRVTLDASLPDVFGQTLGQTQTLKFRVGSAKPFLVGPDRIFLTQDPSASEPALSLYAMNYSELDVRIYGVQPADWPDFTAYLQEFYRNDQLPEPPGHLLLNERLPTGAQPDVLTEVHIPLDAYPGFNHFIVIARPPKRLRSASGGYWGETVQVWVQVTQIGLDAFFDDDDLVVWTSALEDGAPLEGVRIAGEGGVTYAQSGPDGLARFPLPAEGTRYLTATLGADTALLLRTVSPWSDAAWQPVTSADSLRWFVFDDRAMYRPGERVHLKGWVRLIEAGPQGDLRLDGVPALGPLTFSVIGPQGNELAAGEAQLNAWGGFDLAFDLPENANLGSASVQFQLLNHLAGVSGIGYSHTFQIQEFRRPEFEVTARNEDSGPYFAGDSAVVAVQAAYYAGGPLPNAETTWRISTSPTNYHPPNWQDFSFGIWRPWWWGWWDSPPEDGGETQTFSGRTDATGTHYLRLNFSIAGDMRPHSIIPAASVMDVNRQAWNSATSLLVHPAERYVGLRTARYFVERGTPLDVDLIVTDLDGNPVAGRTVEVTAARMVSKFRDGEWVQGAADEQTCTLASAEEPVTCTFETPLGGRYEISAVVRDDQGRGNLTRIIRWVSGGELVPSRQVEREEATLIPDKESYAPGDVAEVLVQSPFYPAEGLLTVARSGILYTERFSLPEGSATLHIPIEENYTPNVHLQVEIVGSAPRLDDRGARVDGAPPRPAYATATLSLPIPPAQRTLALDLQPEEPMLKPGGSTQLNLTVTDAAGQPVPNAEVAVVVVDESILALTNYRLADPLAVFYDPRPAGVDGVYGRASIILVDPLTLIRPIGGIGGAEAPLPTQALGKGGAFEDGMAAMVEPEAPARVSIGDQAQAAPIALRTDFNPLATFAPSVQTDAQGRAVVEVQLPDNLTRYRIMAVAVDAGGQQFGSAEASLTARLPLMVRPSAPRFLNFGDVFEFPVVLQNQTDEPLAVDVVLRAANLTVTGAPGLHLTVPANDRVEVRFPAAAEMAGTARFQVAAVSGENADAAYGELPVYTPATTEAFAVYGVVDEGALAQPVLPPADVFPQFGGLEVQTSATALQALTDAVLYLVSYPYECSEQLASRILAVAALREVLSAFDAEGLPQPEEMEAAVQRDIATLQGLQNYDGGFPCWRRGQESNPFDTVHVAHALQRAAEKGFEIPDGMLPSLLTYLANIESRYPSWYGDSTRWTISAYALYVRQLMGDSDPFKAHTLLNEAGLENLPLEAVGWLWPVLRDDPAYAADVEAIRVYIGNRVVETAGAANFITSYDEQNYLTLGSNRRTDAILLDALMADDPASDLIPKLVNGLLAHRTCGRWRNTQENVFVLLALDRYFNMYEAQTPDFVARLWLGETYAGAHEYRGYTTERHVTAIPMDYLLSTEDTQDLILSKEGDGRLYYRLGLRYAPTDLNLEPLDMGFVVLREYEAVDDPQDLWRDEDGIWHVRAGARVRVRLTMVADSRRYHVALVDYLPAGLEAVNPALAVSGSLPPDPNSPDFEYGWWWRWPWYEHQNLRDERAEAFATLLWDGVYEYTYIARATTPGTFIAPPARAEEMYSPDVFGRSGSAWVIVEASP